MSAIVAAFGAVIGYLGSEVAEKSVFERLLWPQRFHNYLSAADFAKLCLLMPMSGPLHGAALRTLDGFRDHGLYKGFLRGDMLGTAFFSQHESVEFFHRTAPPDKRLAAESVRNGFWLEVLKEVERQRESRIANSEKTDSEAAVASPSFRRRATKPIFRLSLVMGVDGSPHRAPDAVEVTEAKCTALTYVGIFASELSTVLVAVAVGLWIRFGDASVTELPDSWLIGYFCIPLFLRFAAAILSVRRESVYGRGTQVMSDISQLDTNGPMLQKSQGPSTAMGTVLSSTPVAGKSDTAAQQTPLPWASGYREIVEIVCPSLGFVLISTQPPVSSATFQFFRHYGHPIRSTFMDRVRESGSIAVVYAFMLYFPAGLFALSWMNLTSQYVWLGQQLYCVLAMHFVRLVGWQGCSRTEERVARYLREKKVVRLVGEHGFVEASLVIEDVHSVRQGRARVKVILDQNEMSTHQD
ncbi:hypothetical protein RB595_004157 [Gaeumannomyces hyphopodioides]